MKYQGVLCLTARLYVLFFIVGRKEKPYKQSWTTITFAVHILHQNKYQRNKLTV